MPGEMSNPQPTPFIFLADMDPQRLVVTSQVMAHVVTPAKMRALVPGVTTYREYAEMGFERSRLEEEVGNGKKFGDNYVYAFHAEGPGTLHTFTFVEKRTEEDIAAPIPWLSYQTTDVYNWPDVLLQLGFVADPSMPMEVVVKGVAKEVPTLFPRMNWVEGGGYACEVMVRIYASHKPFERAAFKLDPPVPTPVNWAMVNSSGNLGKCLHPYLEFPESQTNGYLIDAGTVREGMSFGQKHIIPATNHGDWRPHVYLENVQQVRGLWMMEQREVYLPRGRRKVRNARA